MSSKSKKSAASKSNTLPFVVIVPAGRKYQPRELNINGSDDMFYRYKVKQLMCQSVGNGKMIKTLMINLDVVAEMLHVPPDYLAAFFGYEIGAQFKYLPKKQARERGFISGEYPAYELTDVFQKFLRQVVICRGCGLAELGFVLSGKGRNRRVHVKCNSCGERYELKTISTKFKNYVLNHPPPKRTLSDGKEKSPARRTSSDSKRSRRSVDKQRKSIDQSNVVETTPVDPSTSAPIITPDAALDPNSAVAQATTGSSEKVVWYTDLSSDAVAVRQKELLPDAVKKLVGESSASSSSDPSTDIERLKTAAQDCNDVAGVLEQAKKLSLSDEVSAAALFDLLFAQHQDIKAFLAAIGTHADQLESFFEDKNTLQLVFLAQYEAFLNANSDLQKYTHNTLHQFYDNDVLEEDALIEWYNKVSPICEPARKIAAQFISWLETADEESSDED